ncbi:MAG: MFS transporter [Deltaproteobacteria bacterium]|nr:MFS transporter [Deltaproteobacteria bacterium]
MPPEPSEPSEPTAPRNATASPVAVPPTVASSNRGVLGVVFLTLFLDLLGFGVILPVQPFYAKSFGASAALVTLISAGYSLMQFLFAPFWGRLSDRIGRRPVVLTSVAFACVGWLLLGAASTLWMLVLSRLLAGFGNANLGTVQAIVADVLPPKDRARGMGMIGASFGLGFLFGPIVGGYASARFGMAAPAFISAGLALLNLGLAAILLKETHPRHVDGGARGTPTLPASTERRSLFPFAAMREALAIHDARAMLVVGFVYAVGFSLMESALSLFVEQAFVPHDLLGSDAGNRMAARLTMQVLVTVGVTAVVVQGGLIRPIRKALSEKQMLVGGALLIVVAFAFNAALPLFDHVPVAAMYPIMVVLSVGSGLYTTTASSLLSRAVDAERQGSVLGVGQSMSALGRILGPAVAGTLLTLWPGLPFGVGAALLLVAALVATTVKTPVDDERAPAGVAH